MKAAELYDLAKMILPGIPKRMFSTFYSQALEELSQVIRLSVPTVTYTDDSFSTLPADIVRIERVLADETHSWKIENGELMFFDSSGLQVDTVEGLTITYWERIRNAIVSPHLFEPTIYTAEIDPGTHKIEMLATHDEQDFVTLDPIEHIGAGEDIVSVSIFANGEGSETPIILPITGITVDEFRSSTTGTTGSGASTLIRYYVKDTVISMTAPLTLAGATPPDTGEFVKWVDEEGTTLGTDATLSITASENLLIYAVYNITTVSEVVVSINATLLESEPLDYLEVLMTGMIADNDGSGTSEETSGDDTDITRTYNDGSTFTITAPLSAGEMIVFARWLQDGEFLSSDRSISITLGTDNTTLLAEYAAVPYISIEDEDGNEITELTAFESSPGIPSASQSYYVRGIWLTNDVTIVPPENFEISLDDAIWEDFESSIVLDKTTDLGSGARVRIYVRYTEPEVT